MRSMEDTQARVVSSELEELFVCMQTVTIQLPFKDVMWGGQADQVAGIAVHSKIVITIEEKLSANGKCVN